MKILWLKRAWNPLQIAYVFLEKAIKKINKNIVFFGENGERDGFQAYKEYSPEVVVLFCPETLGWRGLEKIKTPKVIVCSDPWSDFDLNSTLIKKGFDLALFRHPEAIPVYQRFVDIPCLPLLDSLDKHLFKHLSLKKKYDLFLAGNLFHPVYKFRAKMFKAYKGRENCLIRAGHPFSPSEYVVKLNETKILLTACATATLKGRMMKFGQRQPLEAMACKTAVATDSPSSLESRHLIPDVNFIEITEQNFKQKIEYYLSHEEEREEIAKKGHETFLKYHTAEIRANELLKELERLI